MRLFQSRRRVVVVITLVLVSLFAFRPGANGLRKRIINSVGLALGRRVDVDWVKLRVLPQPGFDLENFVVHDDTAVSAEPLLRAQEVTAVLRLRSLLRGRLEIGRLSLREPSFNLVRGPDGHWNIESLLERAAHAHPAPTRNTLPERRPLFPYIEAVSGRINFKIGAEKKAYALTDADFALWLESDDQWGMRLAAQPVRTDYNLSDTGVLRISGTWQRSLALRDTPMKFDLQWQRPQLGQLTKLLYGADKGWRGGLSLSAEFSGTPADLLVKAKASIDDFRRYDIVSQQSMRLASTCEAHYSSVERALSNLICRSPIGGGSVLVEGRIGAPTGPRTYDLTISARNVPMQAVMALSRRVKKDLPDDFTAKGAVRGTLSFRSSDHGLEWNGRGDTDELVLRSATMKTELPLGSVPFTIESQDAEPKFQLGPSRVPLGRSSYATLQGSATLAGYRLGLQGDAQLQRLLQGAQIFGWRGAQPAADGTAKINLQIAGDWSGSAAPLVTGTAQLHSVRADLHPAGAPLTVATANVVLEPAEVRIRNIAASAAGTNWTGSLSFPRPCSKLSTCGVRFDLHADTITVEEFQQWLNATPGKRPWYRLGPAVRPAAAVLRALNVEGQLSANRIEMRAFSANRVSARVTLHEGEIQISDLSGDFLGGKHRGNWEIDLRSTPPTFTGTGALERVALEELAHAMHDGWISGTAKATYQITGAGSNVPDFLADATGDLRFEMRDGLLPHIVAPAATAPLRVRRFRGRLTLRSGVFELQSGTLDNGVEAYQVRGTASPGQKLDIRFARNGSSFQVNGTLSEPHVVPASAIDTRAALKP